MQRVRMALSSRARTYFITLTVWIAATLAAGYVAALVSEGYSAWEASRTLDQIELLRVDSPVSDLDRAVRWCRIDKGQYSLTAGPYRIGASRLILSRMPAGSARSVGVLLRWVGLGWWALSVRPSISSGLVRGVRLELDLAGPHGMLGARWQLSERVPLDMPAGDDQRTALTTHQIDTSRGGQAFEVDVTPASTDKELNARRINRKCLLSFSGCDGLGELLPGVLPVLCDRKHSDHTVLWGGCTDDPFYSTWCDSRKDRCRRELVELKTILQCR